MISRAGAACKEYFSQRGWPADPGSGLTVLAVKLVLEDLLGVVAPLRGEERSRLRIGLVKLFLRGVQPVGEVVASAHVKHRVDKVLRHLFHGPVRLLGALLVE